MPSRVFSEIFLHFNWHTQENARVLTGNLERWVHAYITNRCRQTSGVYFHDLGGTNDHIHLSVRIEPHVTISEFIKKLKGSTSHDANEQFKRKILYWQRGYGVVSFGRGRLKWVQSYVRNQRQHHAKGRIYARLEAITADEEMCQEESAPYGLPSEAEASPGRVSRLKPAKRK
jgi:putative transposase